MADNLTKTFNIQINGVKESITSLTSLEKVLERMEKTVENINKNGGFTVITKEANKNTKEAIDLAKAEEVAQGKTISSYKEKQKALSSLGKEIKSMTAADDEAIKRQGELINEYNQLNSQLKAFDATMGNHQRNVGDYRGALKEAKEELKNIKAQMVGLDQFSAEYAELAKRGGDVADKMGDINEAIKRQASDTKALDAVIDYAKSATAAFTLYKGAMSAFGVETKETEKAMQELLGAMSMIQSLQQLSESFQSTTATGKLLHKTLQMVGLESKTAAASTTALATAENVADAATKKVNLSLKATKLALASLGIGLVILAVSYLVEHWEDLCGWFNKSFPIFQKCGGVFNTLKGVVVGFGKAVIQWITNPWKTVFEMFKKALSGDFAGAIKAGIDGIKNQFAGVADAFKEGFQGQVEKGLEKMTLKTVEETNKQTQQQLKELKIQERNNKTYSDKYINLQKKDFAERKKLARGNKDELNKIKLEEMQFFADVEDKKTAAAKAGAKEREKAAKDAAQKAKEETKKQAEEEKRLLTSQRALRDGIISTDIVIAKNEERIQKQRVEAWNSGPIEKYTEELSKLWKIQQDIINLEIDKAVDSISDSLQDNISGVTKTSEEWKKLLTSADSFDKITSLKLSKEDMNEALAALEQYNSLILKGQDEINAGLLENNKSAISVIKNELNDFTSDFQKRYKTLIEKVNAIGHEQVERNNIWGTVQTGKTLANLEILKAQWEDAYVDLSGIISNEEVRWEQYLEHVRKIYGEDTTAFKKAQKEKEESLDELYKKLNEVWKRAKTPTSTETDYTGDNNPEGSTKPKRKLWYGKGDKKQDGSEYSLLDNLTNMFQSLDEMVLAPAMDTFAMYMDFAIEETQQKLEEVEKMHDKALEKVEESADRIKELNESLKDSSNTNMDVTKQQLADEQLLYAQRLAEEKKLSEEERGLKNKAAKQEATARKAELGYQLVMGIANTAQGATKALATWGWPLGPIFAALMAALGAVQTAIIAKQIAAVKPVKYAEGGMISGPSHAQGGVRVGNTGIEVEGGEAVINKRSTAKYLSLLDAINADGNGGKHTLVDRKIRKFANGGQLNFEAADDNLRRNNDTNRLINAIDGIDMQPVVAVKSIWKAEDRLVRVRALSGLEGR